MMAGGADTVGAVAGADTVFVGRDYLIALASMGGRASPQAKRSPKSPEAPSGAAPPLSGAAELGACCGGLVPGAVVVSEGGELPSVALSEGLELVGSVDLGSLHSHPVYVYQRVLLPSDEASADREHRQPPMPAPSSAAALAAAPVKRAAARPEDSRTRLRSRHEGLALVPAARGIAGTAEGPELSSPQDSALLQRKRRSPVLEGAPEAFSLDF